MKSDRRRRKDKEDGNAKQKCKEADWHGAFYRADYWASVARHFMDGLLAHGWVSFLEWLF